MCRIIPFDRMAIVMVEGTVPGIQDHLEERVRVRVARTSAHLHREQQEKDEPGTAEECGEPAPATMPGPTYPGLE